MKKIVLRLLFMSAVSMIAFAGDMEQGQTNEFNFMVSGPGQNEARQFLDVNLNLVQYETFADFIAAMRNTVDPASGRTYVEGDVLRIIRRNRGMVPLNANIADLNIVPDDYFHIVSRVQAHHHQPEAPQEIVEVDEVDEVDGDDADDSGGGSGSDFEELDYNSDNEPLNG